MCERERESELTRWLASLSFWLPLTAALSLVTSPSGCLSLSHSRWSHSLSISLRPSLPLSLSILPVLVASPSLSSHTHFGTRCFSLSCCLWLYLSVSGCAAASLVASDSFSLSLVVPLSRCLCLYVSVWCLGLCLSSLTTFLSCGLTQSLPPLLFLLFLSFSCCLS